jgi:hypothetical protein
MPHGSLQSFMACFGFPVPTVQSWDGLTCILALVLWGMHWYPRDKVPWQVVRRPSLDAGQVKAMASPDGTY